jgi:DNA-directed RNA polymerase subunit beta'
MNINNVASVQIGLASPERILEWSHGEVKKPETINYRSQKPERDGLFCEKIFGPTKDWECYCGKYKKVRYKGVVCDKCGVEITRSSVRRERMGHISLAAPVAHIWYLKGTPSRISLLLDVPPKQLEEVVYFVNYIVTDPGEVKELSYKQVLTTAEYRNYQRLYGSSSFTAMIGAEAIKYLLEKVDLDKDYNELVKVLETAQGEKRKKLIKRLETVSAFRDSKQRPEWMILTVLPVIPPDLRPMMQLDGGRFATSDLNDLYRRVITRNNRLQKLLDLGTPAIIVQNEKRMLQEAVDALIDNGRRSKPVTGAGNRALKSLSHALKGKQGRFRQNLLGKRVDFSGRSVIAVGPDLKMYQCGIPREMALQLFKPFVINELVFQEIASNPKAAEKLIEKMDPRIWDIVEQVVSNHPVLLNRAPTLHRLGIQAFMPKVVEGRAIRLHPLVCTAFNADFDGDQMAVHVPLSEEACAEAKVLMLGSNNILGPKDGLPIVTPSQDMVLGNFYLTMEETKQDCYDEAKQLRELGDEQSALLWETYGDSEGRVYKDVNEVLMAYDLKQTHLHTRIAIKASALNKAFFTKEQNEKYLITTVGKIIFNQMFPSDFPYVNEVTGDWNKKVPDEYFVDYGTDIKEYIANMPIHSPVKKKDLGKVIGEVYSRYANEGNTYIYFDRIKNNGFKYSTVAGMTISLNDIKVASNKEEKINEGKKKQDKLMRLHKRGLLTEQEWEKQLLDLWGVIKDEIGDQLMKELPTKNPINMMAVSGARGNKSHFTQLAGMRGLMGKPTKAKSAKGFQSSIIEVPIYSNFREGLNVSEFFISTHGIRKGLTDTALKTASSGYLTRRLVDVAQDVIVVEDDCGTENGYLVSDIIDRKSNTIVEGLHDRLVGRFTKQDVFDPKTGELIIADDEYIDEKTATAIVDAGIKEVYIRNAFVCQSEHGVCRKCYGKNMATGKLVENGESVGIMAAQSIGEPGTQLTMRNFHTGGVAGNSDITQGLPRVEELFEARCPKHPAIIAKVSGTITEITDPDENGAVKVILTNEQGEQIEHKVDATQAIRSWWNVGSYVEVGDKITEGTVNPKELIAVSGVNAVQNYILKEVMKVYRSQGIEISDKHLEIMICQMLRKVVVEEGNDTGLTKDSTISKAMITEINDKVLNEGGIPAKFKPMLLGISKSSVETDSWMSAASFQETTKVLTEAAVKGKVDYLKGLKENVIIGKMIPAGTGTTADRESTRLVEEMAAEMRHEKELRLQKEDEKKSLALREYASNDDDDDDNGIDISFNSTDDESLDDEVEDDNTIDLASENE